VSDSEHDDDFEAYLKRRVPIHKGSTPPDHLEPPPELDRIIIGNARRAIQGTPPVRLYRAPKWALPVGLAATIVISSVVVLELGLRAKQPVPAQEPVETELVAEAPTITAPDAAVPETSTSEHKPGARSPGHRGAPKAAKRIRLPAIPTTPWPPLVTPNTAPAVAADAGGQPDAEKARTRLARVEVAASRLRDSEAAAAHAPAPPAAPARLDAATWLRQIEKLRSEGQTAEAERQLKLFREVYPDFPVGDATGSADGRGQ
jgi:hypothetical protein